MNGRDDVTTFLPLDSRLGGQSRDSHPTIGQYLTRDQTKYVYKKVEMGEMIKRRYNTRNRAREEVG